ncbi:MAG: PEP-CTERM sorting domain-containing protein [Gammaproteobacteria bacterium]|nr:PEP-CTERM sorting domain-containing protein [Gammaproteobacteria bacterium]
MKFLMTSSTLTVMLLAANVMAQGTGPGSKPLPEPSIIGMVAVALGALFVVRKLRK